MTDDGKKLKIALGGYSKAIMIAEGACDLARQALIAYCKTHRQNALAQKLEITPQYLSDVIRGRRDLNRDLAERIIRTL